MLYFLGIDPSLTNSGLVVVDSKSAVYLETKLTTSATGIERLFLLEKELIKFLDNSPEFAFCCIEGPAHHASGKLIDIGKWLGILHLTLYKRSITYIEVAPSQLKKYISGSGKNTGKETILLDIYKKYSIEFRDSDIADAFVLAKIAHDLYLHIKNEEDNNLYKYQTDVLCKLLKTHIQKIEKYLI